MLSEGSLAERLGYRIEPQSGWKRMVPRIMGSRPMAFLGRYLVPPLDRMLHRLGTSTALLSGLDPIWLETIGARSGMIRSTPLFGIPHGDDLVAVGTAFGKPRTPDWVSNLLANPEASVTYRGVTVPVRAELVGPEQSDVAWEKAISIYPGYTAYRRRLTGRPVHLFALRPKDAG